MLTEKKSRDISAFSLHVLAMAFMLCDHLWATVIPGNNLTWLTCVGRMAYPIFAFLLAEGFHYTRSRKKYALRLLLFAVISEIPFNLMCSGLVFYPFHQNVIWTFLLSFLCLVCIEKAEKLKNRFVSLAVIAALVVAGWLFGTIFMVDYFGAGVLTVLVFYFFRGEKLWHKLGQAAGLVWINCVLLASLVYPVELFGCQFEIPQQGFAVLALIFIWLYRGRQGIHNKIIQLSCYAFYPVHMIILYFIYQIQVIICTMA